MSADLPKFMDAPSLAAHLCMDVPTVRYMVQTGELPAPETRHGLELWRWADVDRMLTLGPVGCHCVYFIEMNDFIKIGFTTNVRRRLLEIEKASPYEVKLLHHVPGTFDLELDLHRKFRHLRAKGEWFRKTDELTGFIDRLRTSDEPTAPNSIRIRV